MRRLALVAVVGLVACGPKALDFSGTYSGTTTTTINSCSTGTPSETSASGPLTLTLTEPDATTIDINDTSNCSNYEASASGDFAVLSGKNCPPQTESYGYLYASLTGGSMTLSGQTLTISFGLAGRSTTPEGVTIYDCTSTLTGDLTKQ